MLSESIHAHDKPSDALVQTETPVFESQFKSVTELETNWIIKNFKKTDFIQTFF